MAQVSHAEQLVRLAEGLLQLRGSCFVLWDDLLPAVPVETSAADSRQVASALAASYGGQVLP